MVNFGKRLKSTKITKKIDPIELYDSLDRASDKGPLRPVQKTILKNWYNDRFDDKDILLKLHTGQGKTLTGLLMLQSRLNKGTGPAIYLCPNNYLVDQTCKQAEEFGINYTVYNGDIPDDFIDEKAILITNIQTLFNGLSKFGVGRQYTEVSTILMDDAHACIEAIKDACKINLKQGTAPHQEILELFGPEIEKQGVGTYADILRREYDAFLAVPYWDWQDKHSDVAQILAKYTTLNEVKFGWQILKDILRDCDCYISGNKLEIIPYSVPLNMFGTYENADQRIFMSATVNDDSFLIKGLGLSPETIQNPLSVDKEKWSGEKMILIPSLIDSTLSRGEVVNLMAKPSSKRKFGVVALVPSFNGTKDWESYGSSIAEKHNIISEVEKLKNKDYNNTLVIANRYDGIDLPDNSCRVLILDSAPHFDSLQDRYIENCRSKSDVTLINRAQKIEQGLGRSVRGEKDYSAIVLIGSELIKLIRSKKTRKYFSAQTRKQIELGLEIAEFAKDDIKNGTEPIQSFLGLLNQLIERDEDWKQFYIQNMNDIDSEEPQSKILDVFSMEKKAIEEYMLGNYKKSATIIQGLIDKHITDTEEKGWYLQEMSKYLYPFSKTESNKLQVIAHKNNRFLLKPKEGMEFTRISKVSWKRVGSIKKKIEGYTNYEELQIDLNSTLDSLRFGVKADVFENALNELGEFLGFLTERPDKEWKEGPDNLWLLGNNEYLLVECKNQVDASRNEINKDETGQMNNASAWFEKNYGEVKVTRVLIIPTKTVSRAAGFTEEVKIMRDRNLRSLVKNVRDFYSEFKTSDFTSLSEEQIQKHINTHQLSVENLITNYVEEPRIYR